MKIAISLLIAFLTATTFAQADTEIRVMSVTGLSGPHQAIAGDTVRIGIEYVNRDPYRYQPCLPFRVYSRATLDSGGYGSGTATWISTPPVSHPPFYTLSSASPRIGPQIDTAGGLPKSNFEAIYVFECFDCNGSGVDTLGFSAAANDFENQAIPPLDSGLMFTIMLIPQDHGEVGNVICVDSSYMFPPTCIWKWAPFYAPSGTPNAYPIWREPYCFEVLPANPTAVEPPQVNTLPDRFELYQNYPNPFNPSTEIRFALPRQSRVRLTVFNLLGEEVITLVDGTKPAGEISVTWNGRNAHGDEISSGVYLYRLTAGDFIQTKKMLLLK